MTRQTAAGSGLIAIAVLMFLSGLGDRIADLKDMHGFATPEIWGKILKDASNIALGVIGGTLLPGPRAEQPLTVDLEKIGHL